MRQFIRHPAEIPIEVTANGHLRQAHFHSHNVGIGGIAFESSCQLEPGDIVELRIACVQPEFESKARVAWCANCEKGYELGVEFLDPEDAFRARMVEQVCYIENYRKHVSQEEGRRLTVEEAAAEWITKYASDFPENENE